MRVGYFIAVVVIVVTVTFLALTTHAAPAAAPAPAPAPAPARPPARAPTPVAPAPAAAPAAGEPLPTMEQLKAQLAEGKQQDVLKQVAKLLQLKGDAAKAYDRYDLLCLRGEAALRAKTNSMAMEAFAQASRATDDKEKQAVARATELLIRRSKPLGYVPRTTGGPATRPAGAKIDATVKPQAGQPQQPIPIIEEADRKRAFAAMFADEMAVVDPKVQAATKANNLPPVIDAIKSLGDLRAIDIAANGSAAQTKALGADLGAHAHELIATTMAPMDKRVEECWNSASRTTVTQYSDARPQAPGLWGLTSIEQNDLKAIISTCEKVQPVASELATVTERAELIADAQKAQKLQARATEVLTFDYPNGGRYNKDPRKPVR